MREIKALVIFAGIWLAYLINAKYGFFCGFVVFLVFFAASEEL